MGTMGFCHARESEVGQPRGLSLGWLSDALQDSGALRLYQLLGYRGAPDPPSYFGVRAPGTPHPFPLCQLLPVKVDQ